MGALLESVRTRLFGQPELQPTDPSNRLRGAGIAFASLFEGLGTGVAKTQRELDITAGKIIKEMAQTQVDTVQAVVSNYDDTSGKLTGVEVVTGQTSALSIKVPPALSFSKVHSEGSFRTTGFSATSTSNVNVNIAGVAVGSKGGLRGLSASASVANVNTNIESEQTQDMSVGLMSVTAQISTKPVTGLAKPPLVFTGPTLTLTPTVTLGPDPIPPLPVGPNDPPPLFRRGMVIQVQLVQGKPPTGIGSRTIALDCAGLDFVLTDAAGHPPATGPLPPTTDSSGSFYVTVSRTIPSQTEAKRDFVIRGSLNLLSGACAVSL